MHNNYKYHGRSKIEADTWLVKDYLKAAKELGYSEEVLDKLRHAKTASEATRIMITARHDAIEKDLCRERVKRKNG